MRSLLTARGERRCRRCRLAPIAAMLLVAGCDVAGDGSDTASRSVTEAFYKARIDALGDGRRNALMLRAVRDAGQDCQGVAGSAYNGEHFGRPSWAVRCNDGRDWLIMLEKDGRALVARREERRGPGN